MSNLLSDVISFITSYDIDVIFLQEIRLTLEQLQVKFGNFGYLVDVNIDEEDFSKPGTAILWKSSVPIVDVSTLLQCRCQIAFLNQHILINVYAHSGSSRNKERGNLFADHIFQFMSLHPNSSIILGGDFNSLLSPKDVENGIGFSQKFCPQLSDLVKMRDLFDAFRY